MLVSAITDELVDKVDAVIRQVGRTAILPLFRNLPDNDIREKRPGDYVTTADLAAERALSEALPPLLPGSVVLGEESASQDPSVLRLLEEQAPVWVLDPIDGTANYASGYEPFATMVALVQHKVTLAGWIYLPVTDVMVRAVSGRGAFCDGEAMRPVAPSTDIGTMHGVFGIARPEGPRRQRALRLADVLRSHHRITCVGADYVDLARDRTQVALFHKMNPWDHAAGILIHSEVGGVAAKLRGGPYVPVMQDEPVLLAPSMPAWQSIRGRIALDQDLVA